MSMAFEGLSVIEAIVPVEYFNSAVIGGCEYVGKGRVHYDGSDIVLMRFELLQLFHCVVVENSDLHVIRSRNYSLLSDDEFGASDWRVADFELSQSDL